MKLGAENRLRTGLTLLLFVGAVALTVHSFWGGSGAPAPATASAAAPVPQAASATRRPRRQQGRAVRLLASNRLDPRLDLDLLKASETTEYAGTGRNIFLATPEPVIPKPVDPGIKKKEAENTPPPVPAPPPPPPINLKFFGFASGPGEPKKIFLSRGDDVFVAAEGDIVDRRYKIVKIGPNSIEVEDVLSNNRQTIPLTQG